MGSAHLGWAALFVHNLGNGQLLPEGVDSVAWRSYFLPPPVPQDDDMQMERETVVDGH